MPENMNIAVLGPVPRDNITTYQGEKLEKFGCAVYTAVCIAALAGAEPLSFTALAEDGRERIYSVVPLVADDPR